jgi:membrane protease YdiL (CAAX protease family)
MWRDERGGWWRLLLTVLLFLFGMLLGDLVIVLLVSAGLNDVVGRFPGFVPQLTRPAAILLASGFAFAGLLLGVRFVHRKSLACIFTDGRPLRIGFAVQSALLWALLWLATTRLLTDRWERLAHRAAEFPPAAWIVLGLAMLCATAVQGTLEEALFRGYLQTRLAAWTNRVWLAVAITAVIFTAAHVDAWTGPAIVYVGGFAIAFGVGCVRAGSLAPLAGMHAVHNAMEFLWFPHEGLRSTTWAMAAVTAAGLSLWLGWLFWSTRNANLSNARPQAGGMSVLTPNAPARAEG